MEYRQIVFCMSIGFAIVILIYIHMKYRDIFVSRTLSHPLKRVKILVNTVPSSARQGNEWIIIAFTDERYLPVSKLWYNRLSSLGYENHHLLALDIISFKDLMKNNFRCEKVSNSVADEVGFSGIWRLRFQIPLLYLKNGKNVFISDVDTHWNFYFDLTQLPPQYDSFHSYATVFPRKIFKRWGFTLCGCFIGYRANKKTIQLLEKLLERCLELEKRCDDQVVLNEMFALTYKMKWVGNTAFSDHYNYTINVFNRSFVARSKVNCDSWISMPGAKKNVTFKLQHWELYNSICPNSKVDS